MNIFALSDSPHEAAIWQHDRHVVKMILESAQMLSTLAHVDPSFELAIPRQYQARLYKSTHVNNPCNLWLRNDSTRANAIWLILHLDSLVAEYHRRFTKVHATNELRIAFNAAACNIVGASRMWERDDTRALCLNNLLVEVASTHTPFAVCMPDEYKLDPNKYRNAEVQSYERLYIHSKIWQDHVKWTKCESLPQFILRARDGMPVQSVTRARIDALVEANIRQNQAPIFEPSKKTRSERVSPQPLIPYVPKPIPGNVLRFGVRKPTQPVESTIDIIDRVARETGERTTNEFLSRLGINDSSK